MKALLDFIARYYYWAVFILLEIISLNMLLRWTHYQRSLWYTAMTEVSGQVRQMESEVEQYVGLTHVNRMLTQRNVVLEERVAMLENIVAELTHDSTYAERRLIATAGDSAQLVPAKVVDSRMMRRDNYIVIDRGSNDGVDTEMGVVCGLGIVGIVYAVSPNFSVVMPVLHSQSSISCRVRGAGYFGYLRWEGGDMTTAVVNDIPRHAQVKPGDIIETSGYSAVFPSGLFVGRVDAVENSDDGLAYTLRVRLGVDFGRLNDVLVVADKRREAITATIESKD